MSHVDSCHTPIHIAISQIVVCLLGHFSIDSSLLNSSFYRSRQIWHPNSILQLQPLFRKIAAALPGMESLSSTKQEDMVDVNLKPTVNASSMEQQGGGCPC